MSWERLVEALADRDLARALDSELDAVAIAEVLWLASLRGEGRSAVVPQDNQRRDGEVEGGALPLTERSQQRSDEDDGEDDDDSPWKDGRRTSETEEDDRVGIGMSGDGPAIDVPDAPSIGDRLEFIKALRPLMEPVSTGRAGAMDEAATVMRIAEEEVWVPVMVPEREPGVELVVVLDPSRSMGLWRSLVDEWVGCLRNYGAFRDVRVWELAAEPSQGTQQKFSVGVRVHSQAPVQGWRSLLGAEGRCIGAVLTDCAADYWHDGSMVPLLKNWSAAMSVTIWQMLPEWLWERTALGVGIRGRFSRWTGQRWTVEPLSAWDEDSPVLRSGVRLPVVPLEPKFLGRWGQAIAGDSRAIVPGVVLPVRDDWEPLPTGENLSPEERLQQFRASASPMARRLAGLLAASPVITLPIVRLIQRSMLPTSQPAHVAEIFLSGLLKMNKISDYSGERYFYILPQTQIALLRKIPRSKVREILEKVVQNWGRKSRALVGRLKSMVADRSGKNTSTWEIVTITSEVIAILNKEVESQINNKESERSNFKSKRRFRSRLLTPQNVPSGLVLLQTSQKHENKQQDMNVTAMPNLVFCSGQFTVSEGDLVSVDWLWDGRAYQGEIGIFRTAGLDELEPGSQAFNEEVVRRVLSQSNDGQTLFSAGENTARFSNAANTQDNQRNWKMKTGFFRKGDKVALALVPKGSFANLAGESTGKVLRSSAPLVIDTEVNEGFYECSIVDLSGKNSVYAFSNVRTVSGSIEDYSDIVICFRGAVSDVDRKQNTYIHFQQDWQRSTGGQRLMKYLADTLEMPDDYQ